ncbi:MAG: FlgB family protein [Paracoccaceae bacterium]
MPETLSLFDIAGQMAHHAGTRQSIVARNVANADTPGYTAMTMPRFSEIYGEGGAPLRQTRPEHLSAADAQSARAQPAVAEASPNGNSVSVEQQMLQAIDASREHGRALAIYRHGLTVMRSALGRS